MTPAQRKCLDAIKRLYRDGVPPSFEELRVELGLASKNGVHRLVHGLAERGHIRFRPDRPQSIELADYREHSVPFDQMARAIVGAMADGAELSHHDVRSVLFKTYWGITQ